MTFDEAWKRIKELSFPIQVPDEADDAEVWISDLIDVFEELRQEYAPTIEMTSYQKENLLMMKNNKFPLIAIVAEFDDGNLINYFDGYWYPLTESQLV